MGNDSPCRVTGIGKIRLNLVNEIIRTLDQYPYCVERAKKFIVTCLARLYRICEEYGVHVEEYSSVEVRQYG